jgi:hypothetical protein
MLTLPYLQNILRGQLPNEINKPDKQIIEAAGGYDGIVSLIQTKGISPMVILENSEIGEFGFLPEGFLKSSQSIWVMKMVAKDEDRQRVQNECMKMVKRILSIMGKHEHDAELEEWEYDRIPWAVRNAGANFTGYEFTLYFSEDTDLGYHG